MSKLVKATIFSILTQHSIQLISFASIVVLARLLTPEEVGVFAVASSLAFLAIEFRSLGMGQYLVREEEISEAKIRSATGLMIIVSWTLAALIIILAPAISNFYEEQALTTIFWYIAATFFIAPFTSIPFSILTRNMQFEKIMIAKVSSSVVRAGGAIALVMMGYSYYGLAMATLAGAIVEFLVVNFFRPKNTPWLPSFSGLKEMMRFGVFASTGGVLQRFSHSVPDLILGKLATMSDVGLFSRALGLLLFLNKMVAMAVQPVVLPHLSEIKRSGSCVSQAYLRASVMQAAFSLPLFALVSVIALPLIRVMFGDQWDFAAPIASILALWAIFQTIHCFSSVALIAAGEEKKSMEKEIVIFISRFVAIVATASYGLDMVAWGMVLSGIIEYLVNSWALKKALGLTQRDVLVAFFPTIILTAVCWITASLVFYFIDMSGYSSDWLQFLSVSFSVLAVWLVTIWLTNHPVWEMALKVFYRLGFGKLKIDRDTK